MTFNTPKCQEIFRNRFTGASKIPFKDYRDGREIANLTLNNDDISAYRVYIKEDLKSLYYKSLLSYAEGLIAVKQNNLSWATVKLYYSVYYGLRCSLLCKNVVVARANRNLYFFKLDHGYQYQKPKDQTDHGGTIETYISLFSKTDYLCSNNIEDKNAYSWMKDCREIVNYKDAEFHDPDSTDMWNEVIAQIQSVGIKKTVKQYVEERDTYCFSPSTAVLAIPTNRIRSLAKELRNEGVYPLSDERKEWIRSIISDNIDDEFYNEILF